MIHGGVKTKACDIENTENDCSCDKETTEQKNMPGTIFFWCLKEMLRSDLRNE